MYYHRDTQYTSSLCLLLSLPILSFTRHLPTPTPTYLLTISPYRFAKNHNRTAKKSERCNRRLNRHIRSYDIPNFLVSMGKRRKTRKNQSSSSDPEEDFPVLLGKRGRDDEGSDFHESQMQIGLEKMSYRKKGKRHMSEEYERHIDLKKLSAKKRGKRPIVEEYERHNDLKKLSAKKRGKRPIVEGYSSSESSDTMKDMVNDLLYTSSSEGTDDGQRVKYIEPSNCFGDIDVDSSEPYYRSNLKTAMNDLKKLRFSDDHIREIKRTPFWLLFKALYISSDKVLKKRCNKKEDDIRQILRAFDDVSESFIVAGHKINPGARDVQLIFGIYSGRAAIPLRSEEYEIPSWVRRSFGKDIASSNGSYILYKNIVFDKLKYTLSLEDTISFKDVARLTHCYLLVSFLAPNRNGSMAWHLTSYLDDFEKIGQYNWAQYIIDMLKKQIRSSKNLKVGGCAMLLPYWICEHTSLIRAAEDLKFPRFLNWDLNDVHKKISRVNVPKLHRDYMSRIVLKPKSFEKKQLSKLLKRMERKDFVQGISMEDDASSADKDDREGAGFVDEFLGDVPRVSVCKVDMPSNSIIGSANQELEEESPCILKKQNTLDVADFPSFSLGISQNLTPAAKVDSVIHNVIDDLRGQHGEGNKDDFLKGCPFVDSVDVKDKYSDVAVLGKSIVPFEVGTLQDVVVFSDSNAIDRLKDELEKVHREKSVISATYLAELSMRDQAFEKLRQEKADLMRQLTENTLPSPTQIYENPANLKVLDTIEQLHVTKAKNDELLKENAELHEKYDKEEQFGGSQPCLPSEVTPRLKKRQKAYASPISMIKRVKERTRKSERVSKELTPQMGTIEIMNLHEEKNNDLDENTPINKLHRIKKAAKLRWVERELAVRKTLPHIKDLIQERWDFGGEGAYVWRGKHLPLAVVTVGNVLSILHHERMTTNVIDSWSDILKEKYGHTAGGKYTMLFSASCLQRIDEHPDGKDSLLCSFVDKRLEQAMPMDFLVFPLNTSGGDRSRRTTGDHWTIIKLNMRLGEWQFFNSIRPRSLNGTDVHLQHALNLVDYVEGRLREVFKRNMPNHPFMKTKSKKVVSIDCLQQAPDSVDCGVIVCQHIENTILKKPNRKGDFSKISSGNYRKKIVEWFMDPFNVEV